MEAAGVEPASGDGARRGPAALAPQCCDIGIIHFDLVGDLSSGVHTFLAARH